MHLKVATSLIIFFVLATLLIGSAFGNNSTIDTNHRNVQSLFDFAPDPFVDDGPISEYDLPVKIFLNTDDALLVTS